MANRLFKQFYLSFMNKLVGIFGEVTVGAVGAPTLVAANSKGIASIARVSAGLYNITMSDTYQKLLNFNASIILAAGAPSSMRCIVRSAIPSTTKVIQILFVDLNGAAVEVDSGSTLVLKFEFRDSAVV